MKSSPIAATASAIPGPAGDAEMLTGRQLRALADADGLTPSALAAVKGTDQSGGLA